MNRGAGFTKIVAGVDLSPPSLLAVGQAMSVARHHGAELVLLLVGPIRYPADGIPTSMQVNAARLHQIEVARMNADRAALEAIRERLRGQGVEISHMVAEADRVGGLADASQEIGADLIVVGTHGRTGLRRLLMGSVAEHTVRLASSSVLVARGAAGVGEGGYRRVVVGTDFSPLATGAIERAVGMAGAGAAIEIVHAWRLPPDFSLDGTIAPALATLREDLAADAAREGQALVAAWKTRGVDVTFTSVQGPSRLALCERAEAIDADLIVVGSHGRRGLRRMILGSVAETTVRHAPCSVLVAR